MRNAFFISVAALSLALAACGKSAPSEAPAANAPAPAPAADPVTDPATDPAVAPAAAPTPPAAAPADQPAYVAAYEALRVALVNDDLAATQAAGAALAAASAGQPAMAAAAKDVAAAPEIEAARLAFGEASRAYIALIVADEGLAAGKHAFRCPMAKGYEKWVQLDDAIDNPYMGQRMLKCGGPVDMAP